MATGSLLALIVLGLAWELWLAPLRPGGAWLVLKVVPLVLLVAGVQRASRLQSAMPSRWLSNRNSRGTSPPMTMPLPKGP